MLAFAFFLAQSILPRPAAPQHLTIVATASAQSAQPGSKISLFLDITPKSGIHVYAPGAKDYIPITVKLEPQANVRFGKLLYPKSEMMTFGDERVPVFQKPFRLTQDVTLDKSAAAGTTVSVGGTVQIQACDDRVCYPPENVPIKWTVQVK